MTDLQQPPPDIPTPTDSDSEADEVYIEVRPSSPVGSMIVEPPLSAAPSSFGGDNLVPSAADDDDEPDLPATPKAATTADGGLDEDVPLMSIDEPEIEQADQVPALRDEVVGEWAEGVRVAEPEIPEPEVVVEVEIEGEISGEEGEGIDLEVASLALEQTRDQVLLSSSPSFFFSFFFCYFFVVGTRC